MIPEHRNPRVVHLIPYHAIGGVEIAARSVPTGCSENMLFERQYLIKAPGADLKPGEYHGPLTSLNSPRAYWHALWRLYRDPPDLLVASLWRSALVLIGLKILRPRLRSVLFLHCAFPFHHLDRLINSVAMKLCDAVWADSFITLKQRVPCRIRSKGRVISFLTASLSAPEHSEPKPRFIFWGRLVAQKGLRRALNLFAAVAQKQQDAVFTIIGPDGGMADTLLADVVDLGIEEQVVFTGPMDHDEIFQHAAFACFYLQTSRDEGMAMSVVEAMQCGLVPVVTPVGEIARYCHDKKNAVLVHDDTAAVDAVLSVLTDTEQYKRMSYSAAEYWRTKPLYREDFLAAAKELIGGLENEA